MGIRKNAKFLTATERENFVRACVMMKADIVNPAAPPASQYGRWDEYNAIHRMIQSAFAPGAPNVNFGHGGNGAYGFLSWHRYFLYQLEQQLQSYVPGVMIPYWDFSDPASIMTDTFLGPNGTVASGNIVQQGYFAVDSPGTGSNLTPAPAWWPAGLTGWRLPGMFPAANVGGLRRRTGNTGALPTVDDIRETLAMGTFHNFQNALESGSGITSGNQMHNRMHGWIGGTGGHMTSAAVSPFDPFFYLLHCNVDRLWAMWQMDGHQNDFPAVGGSSQHHLNDIIYPWTGGTPGYGTNASIASAIPMPNYNALGVIRNSDTLDFRAAFDYTYDTIAIIGIAIDRTGSMIGLTPDPMVAAAPDVTKWEAAKRGVSAFLQDCETIQHSGAIYVMAGIKTFRSLIGNNFNTLFAAPGYGLVKAGTNYSRASFESSVAALTPGGGTPLADALSDIHSTIVEPPFAGNPSDEQRYIAFLTDGILTTGSPMNSIPNGSFNRTAIFAMGFGTGADVDYGTLASLVAKGKTLPFNQIFHGENAGTIDKFYSNSLAKAIDFNNVLDPVLELFPEEHTHLDFSVTSADDAIFITAQGMDFQDSNWSFMLHGPGDQVLYGSEHGHQHANHCNHCCPSPHVTSHRSNGRLSMVIQRGNTGKDCWVGKWQLMISYKAKHMDKMMMPALGELLFPVAAGPVRGKRYSRLLMHPGRRIATRNIFRKALHGLDDVAVGTNNKSNEACSMVVNIYNRSNLKMELGAKRMLLKPGEDLDINVVSSANMGSVMALNGLSRIISPAFDIEKILPKEKVLEIIRRLEGSRRRSKKYDIALLLAEFENSQKEVEFITDVEGKVVSHHGGPLHIHYHETKVPGAYHVGVHVNGIYYPGLAESGGGHHDHGAEKHPSDDTSKNKPEGEEFSRIFNITLLVSAEAEKDGKPKMK
jgi:hypothetical protein